MPTKSKIQGKLFRLLHAVQSGKVSSSKVSSTVKKLAESITKNSVDHFTKIHENESSISKVKETINKLKEAEYSLSKFKKIDNKSFDQVLRENVGVPFDNKELMIFQTKQNNFTGFGKTRFLLNKNTNTVNAEVFSNGTSKNYVFKKLIDTDDNTVYTYACFIQKSYPDNKQKSEIYYALSSNFDNTVTSEKTKVLTDFIDRINSYGF